MGTPGTPRVLIVALGNPTAGDDEFGPLVARALDELLAQYPLPDVRVVNLAMNPFALLDHLPGPELLIIVDAAQSESAQAGQLVEIDWFSPDRPPLVRDAILSTHGLSIGDDIALAHRLNVLPREVRLVAVMVGSTRIGGSMRHEVRRQVLLAARRIQDYLQHWLARHPENHPHPHA